MPHFPRKNILALTAAYEGGMKVSISMRKSWDLSLPVPPMSTGAIFVLTSSGICAGNIPPRILDIPLILNKATMTKTSSGVFYCFNAYKTGSRKIPAAGFYSSVNSPSMKYPPK